jgi:hypothetical protein
VFLVSEAENFEERLRALEIQFSATQAEADARIAKLEHERDEYKKLAVLLQEQGRAAQAWSARAKSRAAAEE